MLLIIEFKESTTGATKGFLFISSASALACVEYHNLKEDLLKWYAHLLQFMLVKVSLMWYKYCRVVRPAEGVFVSVKKSLPQKTWKVWFLSFYWHRNQLCLWAHTGLKWCLWCYSVICLICMGLVICNISGEWKFISMQTIQWEY